MAKISVLAGAQSVTVNLFIQDSSSTTGAGLTGLVFNSPGLTAYYALPAAAPVAITLATLAAVNSAYSSGGFKELDATNMPGWYRFDIPNAALASGRFSSIHLKGATNMAPLPLEIELTAVDNQDAVKYGMTGVATPTNITAGVITTVTNLTNAPTVGDLTAAMKTSVTTAATAATPTAAAVAGNVAGSVGSVLAAVTTTYTIKKNVASANFMFVMTSSTTGAPAPSLTVTATRSIDGAAFAACANAVVEVANGVYKINLAAADLNGNFIALRFTATGANDSIIVIATQS